MKHIIRRNGQLEELDFELGSGVFDANDREIFEGDIVKIHDAEARTAFEDGSFFINDIPIWRLRPCVLEVVGHVEDTK